MTNGWSLQRWSSPDDPSHSAAELLVTADDANALPIALARVASMLRDTNFLIVPIDELPIERVQAATRAFHQSGGDARLCFAGRRATLDDKVGTSLDNDRVGLMLHEIDELTPLSDLIWDRIEAVRFSADFVARATRNMRLGFVLESMLVLAKDLGLCTLGSSAIPDGARASGRFEFDFVPQLSRALDVATPRGPTFVDLQDIAITPSP